MAVIVPTGMPSIPHSRSKEGTPELVITISPVDSLHPLGMARISVLLTMLVGFLMKEEVDAITTTVVLIPVFII